MTSSKRSLVRFVQGRFLEGLHLDAAAIGLLEVAGDRIQWGLHR
eukprot:CAMPEP_0185575278 /NCGR_PEP_ID=MMETSP0434-20130131/6515_1 /TAXON_ID=626734 ORGANISM="Favella taraikaensis, Strain Fe Narragansett Bay" /NCGR_SAMPLE_ID=MMETSP0434 /ASSEMBLY_ACC=CAM_ASM_000379 /LENGTH=43 /DNA_ID= /DNA_START= /DNA_END= /DNA_ORIENTATION=